MKSVNQNNAKALVVNIACVCEMLGASRSAIYAWRNAGDFPSPIKLGPKRIGWKVEEVERWVNSREAA